ncbi:hypothetical protein NLI96_g6642 [Meripilus lineatus]|uniref:Helicase C-terminal domain-containing protein n=1 Tax=Meripilus lineatus TaxID=2056292 RepID=A0AAD5V301_9APHY|nr:hypothetical protein NLI96_g6642 [Physisporinus lineatus]
MRDLLSRGIGVHHGGLLPIVKEVVELLFARGLVKVLFATETFAMGVNMPARCVVFSHIRKHDGRSFREILPGEYTQMAGRAGRRGLDATGTVIIAANDDLPEFRLTYNMILNLLRVEALRVEEMIKRSFSENASQKLLPDQQKKVAQSEKDLSSLPKLSCEVCLPDISKYYDQVAEIIQCNDRLVSRHPQLPKILSAGRVVVLRDGHFRAPKLAVILKLYTPPSVSDAREQNKRCYILALSDPETKSAPQATSSQVLPPVWPFDPSRLAEGNDIYEFNHVPLSSIAAVTSKMIKVDAQLIVLDHRISCMREAKQRLQEALHEWIPTGTIPEVDWGGRVRTLEVQDTLRNRDELISRLPSFGCKLCEDFDQHYLQVHGEKVLKANIAFLKMAISEQNLELIPDYEQRIEVLQELKFIDENSTVLLKGRVACEINSANELVLTELILENTLGSYEPEEVVALLSCFVFQEKTDVEPVIPPRLQEGRDAILAIADRVEQVQSRHKVPGEDFRKLKFGLIEVVYEWAKGMPFQQITELTDVAEGTIVRVITRLDETCREVRDAARVIGDAELFKKMEEAQIKIKRDIVFAASLYF